MCIIKSKIVLIIVIFAAMLRNLHATDANSDNEIVKFKSCKQSSDYKPNKKCEWAIDGQYEKECTVNWSCTRQDTKAWWSGTLGRKTKILQVWIIGRKTSLTDNKQNNFKVILDGGKVCAEYNSSSAVQDEVFKCVGVSKTVRIQLSGTNYLALCLVTVIGKVNKCKPGFSPDDKSRKCYTKKLTTERISFDAATDMCKQKGGRLPELRTEADFGYFENTVLTTDTGDYWLNGYGKWINNSWRYFWFSDNGKITTTNWLTGQSVGRVLLKDGTLLIYVACTKSEKCKWGTVYKEYVAAKFHAMCQSDFQ